jgi:hypothetical protein
MIASQTMAGVMKTSSLVDTSPPKRGKRRAKPMRTGPSAAKGKVTGPNIFKRFKR